MAHLDSKPRNLVLTRCHATVGRNSSASNKVSPTRLPALRFFRRLFGCAICVTRRGHRWRVLPVCKLRAPYPQAKFDLTSVKLRHFARVILPMCARAERNAIQNLASGLKNSVRRERVLPDCPEAPSECRSGIFCAISIGRIESYVDLTPAVRLRRFARVILPMCSAGAAVQSKTDASGFKNSARRGRPP